MIQTIQPKKKTDVQFNGNIEDINWSIPMVSTVKREFDQRIEKIKESYEDLMDEIYWNNLIYSLDFKFKPVIGNTYHLYKNDDTFILTLIAPNEWKKEHIASFNFTYSGKWVKIF